MKRTPFAAVAERLPAGEPGEIQMTVAVEATAHEAGTEIQRQRKVRALPLPFHFFVQQERQRAAAVGREQELSAQFLGPARARDEQRLRRRIVDEVGNPRDRQLEIARGRIAMRRRDEPVETTFADAMHLARRDPVALVVRVNHLVIGTDRHPVRDCAGRPR